MLLRICIFAYVRIVVCVHMHSCIDAYIRPEFATWSNNAGGDGLARKGRGASGRRSGRPSRPRPLRREGSSPAWISGFRRGRFGWAAKAVRMPGKSTMLLRSAGCRQIGSPESFVGKVRRHDRAIEVGCDAGEGRWRLPAVPKARTSRLSPAPDVLNKAERTGGDRCRRGLAPPIAWAVALGHGLLSEAFIVVCFCIHVRLHICIYTGNISRSTFLLALASCHVRAGCLRVWMCIFA